MYIGSDLLFSTLMGLSILTLTGLLISMVSVSLLLKNNKSIQTDTTNMLNNKVAILKQLYECNKFVPFTLLILQFTSIALR